MKRARADIAGKEPKKPYGFVLVLRGLARAAIRLDKHPAALRVLCIAAEYMNQDGLCRIGQDTIAARLSISRQGVNRHLSLLDKMDILISGAPKDGVLKNYVLDTDGLEDEREGQERVEKRRKIKRAARGGKRTTQCEDKPISDPPPIVPQAWPLSPDEVARKPIAVNDEVGHVRFGRGIIQHIEGDVAVVRFPHTGAERKIRIDFLSPLATPLREGATSEVAGCAAQ